MSNFSYEFCRDEHWGTGSRCKSLRTQDGDMLSFFTYSLQTLEMNMASVACDSTLLTIGKIYTHIP